MKIQMKELLAREIAALGTPQRAMHCPSDTSVEQAILMLRKEQVGSLVIVDDGKINGIFTERDFVEKIALKGIDMSHVKIEAYMTKKPVMVKRHQSIGEVLSIMRKGKFRHIIIVDAYEHLEKVVSMREITDYLMEPLLADEVKAA